MMMTRSRSLEVDVDYIVKLLLSHLPHARVPSDTCVVHHYVQRPERPYRQPSQLSNLCRVPDVAFGAKGCAPAAHRTGPLCVDVGDNYLGAVLRKRTRNGQTYSLAPAGDDSDAAVQ
jgi:hypothetical protein